MAQIVRRATPSLSVRRRGDCGSGSGQLGWPGVPLAAPATFTAVMDVRLACEIGAVVLECLAVELTAVDFLAWGDDRWRAQGRQLARTTTRSLVSEDVPVRAELWPSPL